MPSKKQPAKLTITPDQAALFKEQILLVLDDYPHIRAATREGTRIEIANRIIDNLRLIGQH